MFDTEPVTRNPPSPVLMTSRKRIGGGKRAPRSRRGGADEEVSGSVVSPPDVHAFNRGGSLQLGAFGNDGRARETKGPAHPDGRGVLPCGAVARHRRGFRGLCGGE